VARHDDCAPDSFAQKAEGEPPNNRLGRRPEQAAARVLVARQTLAAAAAAWRARDSRRRERIATKLPSSRQNGVAAAARPSVHPFSLFRLGLFALLGSF